MNGHELARLLLSMEDVEVLADDEFVVGAEQSSYDTAAKSNIPCICLELADE